MTRLTARRTKLADDFATVKLLGLIQSSDLTAPKSRLSELKSALDVLGEQLDDIKDRLKTASPPLPPENLLITDATDIYRGVSVGAVSRARDNDTDVSYAAFRVLVEDTGKVTPAALTGLVTSINELSVNLKLLRIDAGIEPLNSSAEELQQLQLAIRKDLTRVRLPEVEIKAQRDVAFTGRTLDTIFRRLNLISFSPVLMMDVAWIGPKTTSGFAGTRYGIGAGARAGLVSLNLTAGYSLNPHPRAGEGRGALVFSLDIRDLFR
jgi:hypothetical protein